MSLSRWLKECALLLQAGHPTRSRRRLLRSRMLMEKLAAGRIRSAGEVLEDRVLPAVLSWVGDVNNMWSSSDGANTNWSGDAMPADGDSLTFDGTAAGTLDNGFAAGTSFSMTFNTGGYTITGESIRLDNSGTDVIQIAGENLLQTPLQIDASAVEV
ncbi:MAG: Hemolysin, chromosomal, partial [Planctomycetota bacterium]